MTQNSQFFGIRPSTNLQFAQLFERPAKPTADTACRVMHAPRVKAETRPKSGLQSGIKILKFLQKISDPLTFNFKDIWSATW